MKDELEEKRIRSSENLRVTVDRLNSPYYRKTKTINNVESFLVCKKFIVEWPTRVAL